MKRRYRMSPRGKMDLREIASYIGRDNPVAAGRWVQKLRVRAREAARAPFTGRRVPEHDQDDLREVILGAYRIVYRVTDTEVVLLTVIEGHRQLRALDD